MCCASSFFFTWHSGVLVGFNLAFVLLDRGNVWTKIGMACGLAGTEIALYYVNHKRSPDV
jgi:hypothetical protein